MDEEHQIFLKNCGEILRMGLNLETDIDFFISNYFCYLQNYRTFLFEDIIVINLNFGRKIEIFKQICKSESVDQEQIRKILEAIKEIQEIRNRVAHDEAFVSDPEEGIKLQKRKNVKYKKDELKITDELVKKLDKSRLFSIQEISKIHMELRDPLRIKNFEW